MRRITAVLGIAALAYLPLSLPATPPCLGMVACKPDSIVVDPAAAVDYISAEWGEAPGQTFEVQDTLLTSLSVWRIKQEYVNIADMKLWITEVDSAGHPIVDQIVLSGPVIRVMYGDTLHATEIRYDLDPPVALPHSGRFAFFIQNRCDWFFDLLTCNDIYSYGHLWRTEMSKYFGCILRPAFGSFEQNDLAFKIRTCQSVATASRRSSWGELKIRYR